jgi:hypothetical protein
MVLPGPPSCDPPKFRHPSFSCICNARYCVIERFIECKRLLDLGGLENENANHERVFLTSTAGETKNMLEYIVNRGGGGNRGVRRAERRYTDGVGDGTERRRTYGGGEGARGGSDTRRLRTTCSH